jgi:hypothetical protein
MYSPITPRVRKRNEVSRRIIETKVPKPANGTPFVHQMIGSGIIARVENTERKIPKML